MGMTSAFPGLAGGSVAANVGAPTKTMQTDVSPSTPQTALPSEIRAKFGLTDDLETALLEAIDLHKEMWYEDRNIRVRKALRAIEYDNGNQYIVWDAASGSYFNPFQDVISGSVFDSSSDSGRIYNKVNNVCQWARKIFVATLTQKIPKTEWWPGNPESDRDNRAAKAKTQASLKIDRDNEEDQKIELALEYLFNTGSYFRNVYYSMDERVTDTHQEPILGWQPRQLLPSRYSCPNCGTETPVDLSEVDLTTEPPPMQCPNCNQKLKSSDFFSGVKVNMPVVVGQKEVPNGAVRYDIWNLLHVDMMPNVDTTSGSPTAKTPLLDLQVEITRGAFRMMYPGAWEEIGEASQEIGAFDSMTARDARLRATAPGLVTSAALTSRMPTYRRVWVTPEAIQMIENRDMAGKLTELITKDGRHKGVVVVLLNRKVVDIKYDDVVKRWTWCGSKLGAGAFPPAIIEPGLDVQDRINDRINSVDEFHDRAGNPPILYDETMVGENINGRFLSPGTLLGLPANRDIGRELTSAFFQPKFTMDNGVYNFIQQSMMLFQLLIGCQPQTYGGSDPNIQTKGGQEQALGTAMTIMVLALKQVRREKAQCAKLAVNCLVDNAQDDLTATVRSEDTPDFARVVIPLVDLAGSAEAYPDPSEGYPVSYDEQQQLWKDLVMSAADNPIINEFLDDYEAQRMALRYLVNADIDPKQKVARDKCLRDLGKLTQGKPTKQIDPQTGNTIVIPSTLPDKRVDDFTISVPLTTKYILKNYDLSQTNPLVFDNLMAYLQLCEQYQLEKQIQANPQALPPAGAVPATPTPQAVGT